MSTEPWNDDLVMSLVDQALAQSVEHRQAYLRSACSKDPGLFEQVWNYVKWEERMNGFLLNPLYPPPRNEHQFQPGQLLDGRFRIVREVAQGGMGVVYEAVDERLDRRIAIKCAKSGYHKRLPPEVRHASEISHPNVCKTYEIHTALTDAGEIDFLTMEFVEGQTLADRLRERALSPKEAQAVAQQLCEGLAEAHRKQVVHGDLKTNNIILAQTSEGVRAVITDFGLARRPSSQQPAVQSGELGGAPDYMAPELLKGEKPSVASDLYALGVILHEMASGRRPFGVECTWEERLNARPAALKHRWGKIVSRCLEPEPARRWTNVGQVADPLTGATAHTWWRAAAAAAVVVAGIVGVVEYPRFFEPKDTVRLAVLPFEGDPDSKPLRDALLVDTGDRLSHVKPGRARFTLIPWNDAVQNQVGGPQKARTVLGATHALSGVLRQRNGRLLVRAYLTDTGTQVPVAEWQAEYAPADIRNMPVALAGMVTMKFRLPPLAAAPTVNPPAYRDWVEGVLLARGDPKDLERAIGLLHRAMETDPGSPLTHARLAEAELLQYRQTGEDRWWKAAHESLNDAELRNPDVAAVRLVSGMINDSGGRYEQAEADLRRALEIEPLNGDVWRQLGETYQDDNRPGEALAAFQKASELQPNYFKNYRALAVFYLNRFEFEESARQYRKMVEAVPNLAGAHFGLARPYLDMGKYSEAEAELRLAAGLRETSDTVHTLAVSLMFQDRNREAIPYYLRALELGPPPHNKYLLYINLGTSYRRAGQIPESTAAYRQGLDLVYGELEKNPKDGFARCGLAYLSARLGDRRGAEANAIQALELSPDNMSVHWMAAQTYEALGERERTLALIQNAPDWLLRRLMRFPDLAELQKDPRFQQLLETHHIQ